MAVKQSITSIPPSPEEERHSRMVKYSVSMGIRMVCIVALVFARGWWLALFAAGAIFLPYFAVVVANQVSIRGHARHITPSSTSLVTPVAERAWHERATPHDGPTP